MDVRFLGPRPTIGVLAPHVGGYYYASVLAGIQRVARERGVRVVAFQTTGLDLLWPSEPHTLPLAWERVGGWIGVNALSGTALYERIARAGKPFVTVSTRLGAPGVPAILPDNQGGIASAVRHLLGHGHRRIGFVGGLEQSDLRERFDGYRAALAQAGVEPDPALFFPTTSTLEEEGRAVGRELLARGLPCTALVVATDSNALGIIHELEAAGRRVPESLAIVGFDDIEQAQYAEPPLASVRVPFDVISARAAEVLLSTMLDGARPPEVVRVPAALVPRDSCGCGRRQAWSVRVSSSGAEVARPEAVPSDPRDDVRGGEALVQRMVDVVTRGLSTASGKRALGTSVRARLLPAAAALAEEMECLVDGRPGLSPAGLRRAWHELLAMAHDVDTVEGLLATLEGAAGARTRARDALGSRTDPPHEPVHEIMRHLRHGLMLSWRSIEQRRARYRESNAQAYRKIDLALIDADLASTQELSWLRWARVRHAVLGEWRPASASGPRALVVRSTFDAEGTSATTEVAREHAPEVFPPAALCAMVDASGSDDIVSVVPIPGRGQNRGVLAVVGPVEVEIDDDTGNLAQWAALLGAAIDRDELLVSLTHAAETLRRSEERYALAAHGAKDGLWDWDAASGRLYVSPRWKAILGYSDEEIGSEIEAWFSRVHEEDLPGLQRAIAVRLEARQTHVEHEYRMAHKDGRWIWVQSRGVVVFDERGMATRLAGSQTDITARKEAEEQLRRSALHDALTGLPNRALLLDRLEQAIDRAYGGGAAADPGARRHDPGARFAVLFLDLDHFKTLNDSLGHLIGDQLLIQIAQRLCACLRAGDTVARLGGDEFAIIVAHLESDEGASVIAERVQDALRSPFHIGEHRVFTSASVGIALSSEKYRRAEDFLRDADTAMYRAKSQGRARHQLFDGQMHEQAMERLRVEAGLRRALERGELALHYQPIVSLETGAVVSVEALIRWKHPDRGLLLPGEFLIFAEESGLIAPISDWVVATACEQAHAWRAELDGPMMISVNVPSQELKDPHLVQRIEGHLRRTGIPATALGLELVESSLIENRGATVANLKHLRDMGIRIAVDDFGTGYSSLSYLKRLPLDVLKIDRSFTLGVPHDPNDTAISKTIIAMARSLNLDVVAEGAENAEQAEFLRANGCRTAQGYFFSRPLSAEACVGFIRAAQRSVRPSRTLRLLGTTTGRV